MGAPTESSTPSDASAASTSPLPYGARLERAVADRGPLCVGLDPHPYLLEAWDLPVDATGLERCARGMVEAVGDQVAVFKPQSAFYEVYGAAGIAVLERVLADIAAVGALSLLDVKRGDIGSTMAAYAVAYLSDGAPLAADAITISPYLGMGSLAPAIDLAIATGRGVYVLARTSNPESGTVQHARTPDGTSVAQSIIDGAAATNAEALAAAAAGTGVGPVGLVIGATVGEHGLDLSNLRGSILAPGLGAQGAGAADLAVVFGATSSLVLPSSSRELMDPGPDPAALRRAVAAAAASLGERA